MPCPALVRSALPRLLVGVAATGCVHGGGPDAAGPPRPLATLSLWADDVWLDLLDREGTIHGPLAREGIFQRFHPHMDPEYALDLRTGSFTPSEDAARAGADEGIRAFASSLSHPHVMNGVEWTQAFAIAGALDLTADYRRDHSLTDRRDYARVGVRWRGGTDDAWTVWSRLGVHFLKPAADVELGGGRTWASGDGGGWRADLRIAALDAFNDFVFVTLGVEPRLVEAHLDHRGFPAAARARLERFSDRWRVEVEAGGSTERQAHVSFPRTGSHPFELSERVGFAGVLGEIHVTADLAASVYARVAEAEVRHTYPFDARRHLAVIERTEAVGAYVRHELDGPLRLEGELHALWRPETRTEADGPTLEHRDRELYAGLALVRIPTAGWTGRIGYGGLDRDAGALLPAVSGRNHRLVTEAGYRTVTGFDLSAGVRWDVDSVRDLSFDGLLFRLSVLR